MVHLLPIVHRARRLSRGALAIGAVVCASCSQPTSPPPPNIDASRIQAHWSAFAAARSQGVSVGSQGETVVADYVAEAFRASHLQVLRQSIPYVRITSKSTTLKLTGTGWTATPAIGTQYLTWTRQPKETVSVNAPIVFAGYGIIAPEFKWDDYKDVDVTGKIVIVLEDVPRNGDHDVFGDLGEVYYSRKTYKFEEAARRGAAGVFIVHDDAINGLSWDAILRSVDGEVLAVDESGTHAALVTALEGWLNVDSTGQLFTASGFDYRKLREAARETNFKPVPLKVSAAIEIQSTLERLKSTNVIGVVQGIQPEYVLVSARWNHANIPPPSLGAIVEFQSDDDGSATAVLLEAARVMAIRPVPLRSVAFIVTTSHHDGLIGLSFYAEHPVFPPEKTIAEAYLDDASLFDGSRHVQTIGAVFQGLAEIMREVASAQGRLFTTEKNPQTLAYYRPSQEAFAAQGIPTMYLTTAAERPAPAAAGSLPRLFNPIGAVRDADFLLTFASRIASATNWPVFKRPGGTDVQIH